MSQMINCVNCITIQDLPAELVELSEEDLQQISGGCDCRKIVVTYPDGTKVEIPVPQQSNSFSLQAAPEFAIGILP